MSRDGEELKEYAFYSSAQTLKPDSNEWRYCEPNKFFWRFELSILMLVLNTTYKRMKR